MAEQYNKFLLLKVNSFNKFLNLNDKQWFLQ